LSTAVVEKPRLFRRADQFARQRPCRHTALFIQFTEVRYRLLDHAPANTNAAH
jgi:hypothetical protein